MNTDAKGRTVGERETTARCCPRAGRRWRAGRPPPPRGSGPPARPPAPAGARSPRDTAASGPGPPRGGPARAPGLPACSTRRARPPRSGPRGRAARPSHAPGPPPRCGRAAPRPASAPPRPGSPRPLKPLLKAVWSAIRIISSSPRASARAVVPLRRTKTPGPAPQLDVSRLLQRLVGGGDGVVVDLEPPRQRADAGQPVPERQLAAQDLQLELGHELVAHRDPALAVQDDVQDLCLRRERGAIMAPRDKKRLRGGARPPRRDEMLQSGGVTLTRDGRLVQNLNALLEVSKAMAAAIDLDSILAIIRSQASAVMEAERGRIFVTTSRRGRCGTAPRTGSPAAARGWPWAPGSPATWRRRARC